MGKSVRFGPFRFDAGRGLLYENDRPVALGSKAAALLRALLEARGDVVSKSDLMDAAWPCLYVEESNLTVQMTALRRCLGDDRKYPTWIETFHRIGYRFAGRFEIDSDRSPVAGKTDSILENRPVVALLPFEPLERAALHPHIVHGFRDTLIVELSRLPVLLKTIDSYSTFTGQPCDLDASDYWISGRVTIERGSLHVEASIGEGQSWKTPRRVLTFKGDISGLFRVQAEVGHRLAACVRDAIPGRRAIGDRRLDDVAQRHFRRGCELLVESRSGNRSARWHLSKAVELHPGSPGAHAFLGIGHYTAAIHYREDVRTNRALALAYTKKAVSLDAKDASARGALGFVKLYDGELVEAEDHLLAARQYDPGDKYALMYLTELRVMQGRHDDAIALAANAVRETANPPDWYFWDLAFSCYAAGKYEEAVETLRRPEIGMFPGKRILAASLARLGRLREAKREAEKFLAVHPRFRISGWSETQPFLDDGDRRHFIDGFMKAGFPR